MLLVWLMELIEWYDGMCYGAVDADAALWSG